MPNWTVDRNLPGSDASASARREPTTSRSTSACSRARREETMASSAIASKPLTRMRARTIASSRYSMVTNIGTCRPRARFALYPVLRMPQNRGMETVGGGVVSGRKQPCPSMPKSPALQRRPQFFRSNSCAQCSRKNRRAGMVRTCERPLRPAPVDMRGLRISIRDFGLFPGAVKHSPAEAGPRAGVHTVHPDKSDHSEFLEHVRTCPMRLLAALRKPAGRTREA